MEANDCPTRLRTAETAELYTTLAEITAKEFQGRENATIARLGDPFVELLFDLFILPEGPRLRDKVPFCVQNPVPSYLLYRIDMYFNYISSRSATERRISIMTKCTKSGAML